MLNSLKNIDADYIKQASFEELQVIARNIQEEIQEINLRKELLNILRQEEAKEEAKDSKIVKL